MVALTVLAALLSLSLSSLPLVSASPVYTPIRCSATAFGDPYPGQSSSIASSTSSAFYATSVQSTVTISSSLLVPFNTTESALPPLTFTSIPSPCFTATVDGVLSTFSPAYGRHLDLQSDLLLIGNPSRDLSSSSSFIDLVLLSSSSSAILTQTQTLYATSTPYLGLVFSLSDDADYLVAHYTADTFAVFHPVWNRAQDQLNSAGDFDVLVTYPAAFYPDSFDLHPPYLAVTGMMVTSGVSVVPTLLLYTAQGSGQVISGWSLNSSVPLPLVAPPSSPLNALPLSALSLPSRALPVSFSNASGSVVLVGMPSSEVVFIAALPAVSPPASLQNAPSSSLVSQFGLDVRVSDDAGTAYVLSAQGLLTFSTSTLLAFAQPSPLSDGSNATAPINVVQVADSLSPNRQQPFLSDAAAVFVAVALSANLTAVLPGGADAARVFLLPATTSPLYYDNGQMAFVQCPPGQYRPSSPTATALPCTFCPTDSFSTYPGSTSCTPCSDDEYCPAGSTYPYPLEVIGEEPEDSIPEFESESFSENFEDLLINGIFSPSTVPMVIAFVVAGVTALSLVLYLACIRTRPYVLRVLSLYSYALMPNEEEEKEKEEELKAVLNEILEEREKHAPKCPHAIAPRRSHSSKAPAPHGGGHVAAARGGHGGGEEDESPYVEQSHGGRGASGAGESLFAARGQSSSGSEGDKEKEHERVVEHTRKVRAEQEVVEAAKLEEGIMKGFFNVLMVLFGVSCIAFSWAYLNNYQPNAQGDSESNNRYRTEELYSVTITDPVKLEGLDAINSVNATIFTHLIGYSGMECTSSSLLGLYLDGCIIQQNNEPCNQSAYVHVYENAELPATCTIEFNLVQGTLLALMAVQTIVLPASTQMQALRYVFQQDAQQTDPANHIVTGETTFFDTATHPTDVNGTLLPNGLAPVIERDWIFGILAQAEQIDEETPPDFGYEWYNTVTSLNTGWLPTLPLDDYQRSQAASVQLVLTMQTETFFRLQSTAKLIQVKAAFLTILLGLIAIFHIIEFTKQVFELAILVLKKIRKNRAVAQVSQLTQAKLNQVVDASLEATGKVVGTVKQGVERVAAAGSPLVYKRAATPSGGGSGEQKADDRHGDASPQLPHRFATHSLLPPIAAPHQYSPNSAAQTWSAEPAQPAHAAPAYSAYPPEYPTVSSLPPSTLPYPVTVLPGSNGSRGGSRAGSRRGSFSGGTAGAGSAAHGGKFEI